MVINDILCVMVWATGILQISCSDFCKQIFRSSDLVDLFEVSTRLCCAKGVFPGAHLCGMDSLASLFRCLISVLSMKLMYPKIDCLRLSWP